MKRFLALILIVSHVLINAAWASSHVLEDIEHHGHDGPHIHLSTLLTVFDVHDSDEPHDHNFEDEAPVHLILYFSDTTYLDATASPRDNFRDGKLPFVNFALSPPVPPPTI